MCLTEGRVAQGLLAAAGHSRGEPRATSGGRRRDPPVQPRRGGGTRTHAREGRCAARRPRARPDLGRGAHPQARGIRERSRRAGGTAAGKFIVLV